MEPRKNDWLATLFFSPDKSIQDLADYGITTDNSSLQNRDYYKNIPAIQEAFTDDHGNFDNAKYNKFYDDALYLYNEAETNNIIGNIMNTYEYAPGDIFAPIGAKRKDSNAIIYQTMNPERRSVSLTSIGGISDPTMSVREVGQTSNVFNWETQQFENWSPNDKGGLFSGLTMPTLVLAKWEEDGTHEWNGRIFNHKKGDLKYNDLGDPYYETLGGRDVEGKDLLHYSDVLTIDGSSWNKYDVFDSDGLDKSVGSTITKTALKILPMFIPYVGQAYGYFTAALELGELLPLLYKGIAGIAAGDTSDMSSVDTANTVQGYFARFNSSQSDYARQSGFFTLENIGEIAQMASMQLFQQKAISKIPGFFDKNKKIIDGKELLSPEAIKWGRGLSFAYMSGTSAQHSYEAFKEAGASDRAAGLGMFATMWAFYGLMSNNYFNYEEVLFGGSQLSKSAIKEATTGVWNETAKKMGFDSVESAIATPTGAAKWVVEAKNKIIDWAKKQNPSSILSTSYKEGIEETMEEVFTDGVKGFFSGLNALGLIDKNAQYNFGFSVEDMATRYFTSFIGGGIGGAMFGLHNKFDESNKEIDKVIKENGDHFQKIVYLFRNGREQEVRDLTKQKWRHNPIASKNLSGYEFEVVNSNGTSEAKYKPAKQGESQNDLIYKELTKIYDRISSIIAEEGLNISDEEIENIISARPDLSRDDAVNIIKNYRASAHDANIFSLGIHTQALQDINSLATDILKTKVAMESMLSLGATDPKTNPDVEAHIKAVKKSQEYQKLESELEQLRTERDTILSGKKNDYYMGLMHFALRPKLVNLVNEKFGLHAWVSWKHGKNFDLLSDEDKTKMEAEYAEYSNIEKTDVIEAYELFSKLQIENNDTAKKIIAKLRGESIFAEDQWEEIKNLENKITEKKSSLEILKKELPEGENTSYDIEKLETEISTLEKELDRKKTEKLYLQASLNSKGKSILHRPELENTNWEDYESSYLTYLDYIFKNGLYLDRFDGDLVNILKHYSSELSAQWQNIRNRFIDFVIENGWQYDESYIIELQNTFNQLLTSLQNAGAAENSIEIFGKIKSLYNNLQNTELTNNFLDEEQLAQILELFPKIGNKNLIEYINIISKYKDGDENGNKIDESPAYEIIKGIAKSLGIDNDIIKLLQSTQRDFINSKRIEEFIVQDITTLDKLKQISRVVTLAQMVFEAGVKNGYNESINPYRTALKKDELAQISDSEYHNITTELQIIDTQVSTLIRIAEINNSQKLREQKDIEINMKSKFYELLIGSPSINDASIKKSNVKDILKKLGIDIDEIISKLGIVPESVNENNLHEINAIMSEIETAIYKTTVDKKLSINKIVDTLISSFDSNELIKGVSTKLNTDKKTIITDYDQLMYLLTIFGAPSDAFYKRLVEVTSSEEFDKAPIFAQEYATRIAYSFVNNTELFNYAIEKIKNLAAQSDNKYLSTKTTRDNLMLVLGSAGVGKSQGVGKLLVAILNKKVAINAPEQDQVDNLKQAIKTDLSFTKDDLIGTIYGNLLGDDPNISKITEKDKLLSITFDTSRITFKKGKEAIGNVDLLIIDEIGLYNRLELEILTKWAKQFGVKIIGLGDSIQNTATMTISEENGNRIIDCGFDDMFGVKAPRLTAPLRPSNIGKYDNSIRLSTALETVDDYYAQNPSASEVELNKKTEEQLAAAPIILKYYEDSKSLYGDKLINALEVSNYITLFSQTGQRVAIITDDTSKYESFRKSNVEPIDVRKIQGREFDYIIVDVDFTASKAGSYKKLKNLYTLSQRSRIGSIIVNKGLPTGITSKFDQSAAGVTMITKSHIDDFKNWKLSTLPNFTSETEQYTYEYFDEKKSSDIVIPEDPFIGVKGRDKILKGLDDLRTAKNKGSFIEMCNAIYRIENTLATVKTSPITDEELSYVDKMKSEVINEGYEIVDVNNQQYYDGMDVEIIGYVNDSWIKEGTRTIYSVEKPEIIHNGIREQKAKVRIIQNLVNDSNNFDNSSEIPVTDESPSTKELISQNTPQDVRTEHPGEVLCTGKDFMEWFDEDGSLDIYWDGISNMLDSKNTGTIKNELLRLRAWFLYGHYLDPNKSYSSSRNSKLVDFMEANKDYVFKIKNHILEVTINGQLTIPLLRVNDVESGEIEGFEIVYTTAQEFGVHIDHMTKIPNRRHMSISPVMVYSGETQIYHQGMTSEELNSGTSFVLVNADPFSDQDYRKYLEVKDGNILKLALHVHLFKVNRFYQFDDIFRGGSITMDDGDINSHTAGRLISIAYQIDFTSKDGAVAKNIEHYLKNSNHRMKIRLYGDDFTAKEDIIVDSYEDFIKIVSEHQKEKMSFILQHKKNGEFMDKYSGKDCLLYILKGFVANGEHTGNSFDFQNINFRNAVEKQLPHGIIKNENTNGEKGWVVISDNLTPYRKDISAFVGNSFKIRIGKIISDDSSNNEQLVKINKQLKDWGIDRIVKSMDTLEDVLTAINNERKSKINSPVYSIIKYNEHTNELIQIDQVDVESYLRKTYPDLTNIQYLHENIDIIDWKYEGILVSLSDGTQKYCVVENDNGQFKTREVSQEFYETLNALITKHAEVNYGDYSRVKEYVERIIYNKPVTKDIVDIFIAKYNNVDVTLLDLVTNHLEEKLKNNECL